MSAQRLTPQQIDAYLERYAIDVKDSCKESARLGAAKVIIEILSEGSGPVFEDLTSRIKEGWSAKA